MWQRVWRAVVGEPDFDDDDEWVDKDDDDDDDEEDLVEELSTKTIAAEVLSH